MVICVLHPETDEHLFRQAWRWRLAYPRLVRQWDYLKHFRQWFALIKRRVSIGVFTDHLTAIVTFRPDGSDVYEVHVDCERGTDTHTLLTALLSIEPVIFEQWQAREIFGGVISRNVGIIRLAEACGLHPDGVEEKVGRHRWVRVSKTRSEYYQNNHWNIEQHGHLCASAGSIVTGHRHAAEQSVWG